ncbi:MAG: hypothetical protein F6J93_37335 [Oscillatoria sp. SIO1A7]|nr:hypothetical protein [Oscillatoria sp. SIO1A7]
MEQAKEDSDKEKEPSAPENGSEAKTKEKEKEKDGDKEKKPSPLREGMKTGAMIGLFFAVSFFWLGYSVLVSWALGAIGGLAGGLIFGWWHLTEEPKEALIFQKPRTLAEAAEERASKQQQDLEADKEKGSSDRFSKILGWFRRGGDADSDKGDD